MAYNKTIENLQSQGVTDDEILSYMEEKNIFSSQIGKAKAAKIPSNEVISYILELDDKKADKKPDKKPVEKPVTGGNYSEKPDSSFDVESYSQTVKSGGTIGVSGFVLNEKSSYGEKALKLYNALSIPNKRLKESIPKTIDAMAGVLDDYPQIRKLPGGELLNQIAHGAGETQSAMLNTAIGLPRFGGEVAADIIVDFFTEPISVATLGYGRTVSAGAKVGAKAAKTIKIHGKMLPEFINETKKATREWLPTWAKEAGDWLMYKPGREKEFLEAWNHRITAIQSGHLLADEMGIALYKDIPVKAQKWGYDMLTGGVAKRDWDIITHASKKTLSEWTKKYGFKDASQTKKFVKDLKSARQIVDRLSDSLVTELQAQGIMTDELATVIESNKGKYLPRLFKIFEDKNMIRSLAENKITLSKLIAGTDARWDELAKLGLDDMQIRAVLKLDTASQIEFFKRLGKPAPSFLPKTVPVRLKLPFLKKKKNLDEVWREALGEVTSPAFPTAKAISQMTYAVETSRLFNFIADNKQWVSDIAKPGWEMLGGNMGRLSNKYVPWEIAQDISEITSQSTGAYKFLERVNSEWKSLKVLPNMATHFRNMMSNTVLLNISGVGLNEMPQYLLRAAKEMRTKGKAYKELVNAGVIGTEFASMELHAIQRIERIMQSQGGMFNKTIDWLYLQPKETLGNIYQSEEQVFKLAKYLHAVNSGVSKKVAAAEAEKWLFNYSKVSKLVKTARSLPLGLPFVTFPAKVLPRVLEVAAKNPARLWKYKLFADNFNENSRERLGMTREEYAELSRLQYGAFLLLPGKDNNGLPLTVDLGYIMPWGSFTEESRGTGAPQVLTPGGAAMPALESGFNKSLYSGMKIRHDTDLPIVKFKKTIDYLYKSYAPVYAPPIPLVSGGGFAAHKFLSAIDYTFQQQGYTLPETVRDLLMVNTSDYYGRFRSLPTVLFDIIFGIKASPQDIDMLTARDMRRLAAEKHEIISTTRSTLMNQGARKSEINKALDAIEKRIEYVEKNHK